MNKFLLLQSGLLFFISFLLSELDSNTVYFLAVVLGSISGSIVSLKFNRRTKVNELIIEFLSGCLVGIILTISLSEYFLIVNWKYLLGFSSLMGLIGLVVAKSLLVLFNENFIIDLIRNIFTRAIPLPENDKSPTETRRDNSERKD